MSARERAICSRVKSFREMIRSSQEEFAHDLGITRNQLAGIEYSHTPVKYWLAYRLNDNFSANPVWLAQGDGAQMTEFRLPEPATLKVNDDKLFSDVFDEESQNWVAGSSVLPLPYKLGGTTWEFEPNAEGRLAALDIIIDRCGDLLAAVPNLSLNHFVNDLLDHATASASEYTRTESSSSIRLRAKEMVRLLEIQRVKLAKSTQSKDILDSAGGGGSVGDMVAIPTWPRLRKLIAEQTSERGAKAALAKTLGVSPQVLNNWLADREQGAPNAELTLKLLAMFWKPAKK